VGSQTNGSSDNSTTTTTGTGDTGTGTTSYLGKWLKSDSTVAPKMRQYVTVYFQ